MVEILICEDNKKELDFLVEAISNYVLMENLDMKIALATAEPDEVIDYVKSNLHQFLCFLDIELKTDENGVGVSLASEIKKLNPNVGIVFVTHHAKYMELTFEYKTEAMGYLLKDDSEELKRKLVHYIDYANKKFNQVDKVSKQKFAFKVGDKVITEVLEDIISFEIATKNKSKITLYAKTRSHEFSGTLDDIEKWDSRFFRCDRSVVVNTYNIDSIDMVTKKVHMVNGDVCSASTRGVKELEKIMRNRS